MKYALIIISLQCSIYAILVSISKLFYQCKSCYNYYHLNKCKYNVISIMKYESPINNENTTDSTNNTNNDQQADKELNDIILIDDDDDMVLQNEIPLKKIKIYHIKMLFILNTG